GHMLPSASRLASYQTNAQTFYATNIMPQQRDFNQEVWGSLEGKVRDAKCSDTLFVVTGTLFKNSPTFTSRDRTITRPSHCFKLLLRTKNGTTGKKISDIKSASELKCIAFLFENTTVGASTSISQAATSVAEIEELSGFTFFRNLDPSIAEEVKSQNKLSDWGF
ncbi:MAG: DNA/RNA non-specific endonuclease, partial [Alistipes sp.]|nr:DNA/RNA non-specific endonuclease [Alistipes sp.]